MAAIIHHNSLLSSPRPPSPPPLKTPSSLPLSAPKPLPPQLIFSRPPPTGHHSSLLRPSVGHNDLALLKSSHPSILELDPQSPTSNHALIVSYTATISALAKSNRGLDAARIFLEIVRSGIQPNEYTFVAVLTACLRMNELELGSQVHGMVMKLGFLEDVYIGNAVMGLYGNCGLIGSVFKLFDEMSARDVVSWNTLLSSLVKEGMSWKAFEVFQCVAGSECSEAKVDCLTVSMILSACADSRDMNKGREVHGYAVRRGMDGNLSVGNALIGFYARCGRIEDVEVSFRKMSIKDVITFTEVMHSYLEFGLVDAALAIYDEMPEKNCISRNALLSGLCRNGEGQRAVGLFIQMVEEGMELTEFSLTTIATACGLLAHEKLSEQVQGFIMKFGLKANAHISAAVLDMCTRSGRMRDAEKIFARWPFECDRDGSIACTSLISGYVRDGQLDEAISTFSWCHSEGRVVLDEVASTSLLGLCGALSFAEMGEQLHCHVVKTGMQSDLKVGNALISMYSKCWNMHDAIKVFHHMTTHDVVSWNALIAGHLLHRKGDEALDVWSRFGKAGIRPDRTMILLVISAYRFTRSCLVDKCRRFFSSCKSCFNVEPSSEHYASFVGVLGFWGFLELAEKMISNSPFAAEASVWRALLDSCRIHSNTVIAKRAIKHLLSFEPRDASTYVLVSNLYSASGRWHCSEEVRNKMRSKGLRKLPSRSWLIHDNKVVTFYTRDKSHSQTKDIYSGLDILIRECLKAGYEPDTSFVLHEVEEHQKKEFLFYHSAKLATSFGLLMTKPGRPIRIMKNILLCGDCHNFLKHASRVTGRDIFLRDSSGVHQFSHGQCSCSDRW